MDTLYIVRRPDGTFSGDSIRNRIERIQPGTSMKVTFERLHPQRTSPQNRWYRGVILPMIAAEAGYDENDMHELLIQELCPKVVIRSTKDRRRRKTIPKRSKNLTTAEFTVFAEKAREFAQEFYGITIPDPVS